MTSNIIQSISCILVFCGGFNIILSYLLMNSVGGMNENTRNIVENIALILFIVGIVSIIGLIINIVCYNFFF